MIHLEDFYNTQVISFLMRGKPSACAIYKDKPLFTYTTLGNVMLRWIFCGAAIIEYLESKFDNFFIDLSNAEIPYLKNWSQFW